MHCQDITTEMIELFNECTKNRDYRRLWDEYQISIKRTGEDLRKIVYPHSKRCNFITQNFVVVFKFLRDYPFTEPRKMVSGCYEIEKDLEMLDDLKYSIDSRNWYFFYNKYWKIADYIIDDVREREVLSIYVQWGDKFYENFDLRSRAIVEMGSLKPSLTRNSGEMFAVKPKSSNHPTSSSNTSNSLNEYQHQTENHTNSSSPNKSIRKDSFYSEARSKNNSTSENSRNRQLTELQDQESRLYTADNNNSYQQSSTISIPTASYSLQNAVPSGNSSAQNCYWPSSTVVMNENQEVNNHDAKISSTYGTYDSSKAVSTENSYHKYLKSQGNQTMQKNKLAAIPKGSMAEENLQPSLRSSGLNSYNQYMNHSPAKPIAESFSFENKSTSEKVEQDAWPIEGNETPSYELKDLELKNSVDNSKKTPSYPGFSFCNDSDQNTLNSNSHREKEPTESNLFSSYHNEIPSLNGNHRESTLKPSAEKFDTLKDFDTIESLKPSEPLNFGNKTSPNQSTTPGNSDSVTNPEPSLNPDYSMCNDNDDQETLKNERRSESFENVGGDMKATGFDIFQPPEEIDYDSIKIDFQPEESIDFHDSCLDLDKLENDVEEKEHSYEDEKYDNEFFTYQADLSLIKHKTDEIVQNGFKREAELRKSQEQQAILDQPLEMEDDSNITFDEKLHDLKEKQAEELKEKREERKRKQKELEDELQKMRNESKERFRMFLKCIVLRQRFEEQEEKWKDWIWDCRSNLIALTHYYTYFEQDSRAVYGGSRHIDSRILEDFEKEKIQFSGFIMKTFNALESDFETLKRIEEHYNDAMFLRVLQKCIADVGYLILEIKKDTVNLNTDRNSFKKLDEKMSLLHVDQIYSTSKLRDICKSVDQSEYQNVEFPKLRGSYNFEEVN